MTGTVSEIEDQTGWRARESVPSSLRRMYDFMSAVRRRQFHAVIGLMLLGSIAELVTIGAVVPFLAFLAGQGASGHSPLPPPFDNLWAAAALFMAAAIIAGALRLLLAWSSQRFVLGLGHDLAVEIQRRTLFQPYAFHVGRNSSETLASLQRVQDFVSGVLLQLMQAVTAGFISLFIVAALIWVDPFTASVSAVALLLIYGCVSLATRRRLARNSALLGSAYGERVQIIQESLGGIRDVIVDHSQAAHLEEFRKVDRRFATARANTVFIGTAPRFIIEAAGMVLVAALALYLSGREGGIAGAIPIIGALALGAQRLLPMVQQLYQAWTSLAGNRSIIFQVVDTLELRVDDEQMRPPTDPLPFKSEIRFEQVGFEYPARPAPAVTGISLSIPHGSRLALIGKTGSGKSTLVDLLMGLIEPQRGQITVDGTALTDKTRPAWRRNIAHVPQAIFLADASIARNIALGASDSSIDEGRLAHAARLAQLDGFIASLPDGYQTRVGERGIRLSGGQRQRLAIARAIYKDAQVLVLDEATSALDDDTEAAVMGALEELGRQGRTIIIVAHRASTIESCEMVARLDDGRLVKTGSVADVLGRGRAA